MIYIQLLGGIGNILFQVFNALSLSIDNDNCRVYVSNNTQSITKRKQEKIWLYSMFGFLEKVDKKPKIDYTFSENGFNYKKIPNFDFENKNIELKGYFQSEKYFKHNKDEIISYILECFDDKITTIFKKELSKYENTCAIHIRRADYLKLQHFHVVQTNEYFSKAINHIKKNVKNCTFIIFSDDLPWCQDNKLFKDFIFAKDIIRKVKTDLSEDLLELYLMSLTDNQIISNSTFSWWGSYLCKNKNKIVIAPNKWFQKGNWNSIYTKDMIIL